MWEIKCDKNSLQFLSYFVFFSDTKTPLGNKIRILSKNDNVYFGMISNSGCLIYNFGETNYKDIDIILDVNFLHSLLVTLNEKDIISIYSNKIVINDGKAEYSIPTYDISIDIESYISKDTSSCKQIYLNNLSLIDKIYDFAMGNGLEFISLQNQHYVASNRYYVTCAITSEDVFKSDTPFWFDKKFIKLLQLISEGKNIEIFYNENMYIVSFNNFKIINPIEKSMLPFIFTENIQKKFDYTYQIKVKLSDIKIAVQRLKNILDVKDNSVYLTIQDSILKIESNDTISAYENIPLLYFDECLKDNSYPVPINYLFQILQKFQSENIIIKMSDNVKDSICVVITDDTQKSFYILMLLER